VSTSPSASSSTTSSSSATTAKSLSPSPLITAPPSPNYTVAIGAGIGIPLGLLAVGLLVYLYFHFRQTHGASPPQAQPLDWYQNAKSMHSAPSLVTPGELGVENLPLQELSAVTPRTSVYPPHGTVSLERNTPPFV
jgi:hypothetical protein